MMTTEETLIGRGELVIICAGLIFILCIIYLVIKTHIDFYRDITKREKFVKELKVGDKFMSDVQLINEDPFKEKQNLITIEVLDIKKNEYGEYWAKVKWSDDNITTMQVMQIYEDFTKI